MAAGRRLPSQEPNGGLKEDPLLDGGGWIGEVCLTVEDQQGGLLGASTEK